MILTPQEVNEVEGDVFGKVTVSAIDATKLSKLYGILSGVYKNIHSAIIREYCSNAWDSHTEAGKQNEPIIVELNYKDDIGTLVIKDVGLGMSPETMETIYFNYLSSTKEDSNLLIGAFGMGSKSSLAYHHTFFITTIYDGIKYEYMFSKQADGVPAGELLKQSPTTDCNGTTITIPVKTYQDYVAFSVAIDSQLLYFPNVYVLRNGIPLLDYKIYENELFYYNTHRRIDEDLHIALGSASYTIDYNELGMAPVRLPFAIKFQIGELTPTPSREDIIYTSHSVALIKERITKTLDWVHARMKESVRNDLTIKEYIRLSFDRINLKLTDDISISVKEPSIVGKYAHSIKGSDKILTSSEIVEKFCFFGWGYTNKESYRNTLSNSDRKVRDILKVDYYAYSQMTDNLKQFKLIDFTSSPGVNKLVIRPFNPQTGYFSEPTDAYKIAYLKDNKYEYNFIYKIPKITKSVYKLLKIAMEKYGINKQQLKQYMVTLSELADEFVKASCKDYTTLEVPSHIISEVNADKASAAEARAGTLRLAKEEGKYSYDFLRRDNSWASCFDTLANIRKLGKIIIYFEKTDRAMAKDLNYMFRRSYIENKKIAIISIAKSHMKLFANDPHVYHYKRLLETPNVLAQSLISRVIVAQQLGDIDYRVGKLLDSSIPFTMISELCDTYQQLCRFSNGVQPYNSVTAWAAKCLTENHRHADKISAAKKLLMQCSKLELVSKAVNLLEHPEITKTVFELCNIPVNNSAYIKEKFYFKNK